MWGCRNSMVHAHMGGFKTRRCRFSGPSAYFSLFLLLARRKQLAGLPVRSGIRKAQSSPGRNRNMLRGPSQSNVDVSVEKRFVLTESKDFELHADFFNLLNHANRDNLVSDIRVADFGRIVSFSSSPRIVQLSLRFNF